jgi:hypothetical protein
MQTVGPLIAQRHRIRSASNANTFVSAVHCNGNTCLESEITIVDP